MPTDDELTNERRGQLDLRKVVETCEKKFYDPQVLSGITNAPGMGCVRSSFSRSASAGGQTMGWRGLSAAGVPEEFDDKRPASNGRKKESRTEDSFITLVGFGCKEVTL
jgi:hypothetical protein